MIPISGDYTISMDCGHSRAIGEPAMRALHGHSIQPNPPVFCFDCGRVRRFTGALPHRPAAGSLPGAVAGESCSRTGPPAGAVPQLVSDMTYDDELIEVDAPLGVA